MNTSSHENAGKDSNLFDYRDFIARHAGTTISKYDSGQTVYAQGDAADAVFYIISGSVKITVISEHGKEGVIALLDAGDFFGEGCLDNRPHRNSTVATTSPSEILRIDKDVVRQALAGDPAFSTVFFKFVLERNEKLKNDLIDQLFNSSEKRLARVLLTLANPASDDQSSLITVPITQETLANMVGTTRARISQFMTKFRKLGYIDYNGQIRVHNSLLNVILDNQSRGN